MDRILIIDFHNAVWRSTTAFGAPRKHLICVDACEHKYAGSVHCECGSLWHVEHSQCYGQLYGFIFNFFRNLRPQIQNGSPDKVFIVLEGHPKFRYDLFPEYKANRIIKHASRQDTYDRFQFARDEILRLLQWLPVTTALAVNYEADDTIYSLCENMKDEDITIISADSDFYSVTSKGL
jgi:5'-3' exonuclease